MHTEMLFINGTAADLLVTYQQKQSTGRQTTRQDASWPSQNVVCLLTFSPS